MSSAQRVVKNTIYLYGKMIISMFIALYSTRLILNALGVSDYGIYNLVAGVIAMLSFLNAAMTVSTQRYMSFYLGSGDFDKQKKIFSTSVTLHLIIGLAIVLVLEIAGVFLFNGFLNIPPERVSAAKMVFHFMVVSTFFTINAVPYDATINAHENMIFESIVAILESFLKLGIAFWVTYFHADKLILYGFLLAALTILIRVIKSVYCHRKYTECNLKEKGSFDCPLFKEMFTFAGWNMFGALSGMGKTQGTAIILNIFFGTVVNAAYGIANQVSGQLNSFSAMMLKAVNPQIMKSEGASNRHRMLRLSMMASKFSFFLLAFFAIPIIFEMPVILKLWLKDVPEYTVIFCDLILISTLINQVTIGLQSAFQATGKIKTYQIVVGSLLLLNLPINYFLLKAGYPAFYALISFIVLDIVAGVFRIVLLWNIAGLSVREYLNRVLYPVIIPTIVSILTCYLVISHFNFSLRFLLIIIISAILFSISIYYTGLCKDEKEIVAQMIHNIINKINPRKYEKE